MANTTPFSDKFLTLGLRCLVRDKKTLRESLDWLRPDDLEGDDPLPGMIVACAQGFFKKYKRPPLEEELSNEVETSAGKILPATRNGLGGHHRAYVEKLYTGVIPEDQAPVARLREFCSRQRMKSALQECVEGLDRVDEEAVPLDIPGRIRAAATGAGPQQDQAFCGRALLDHVDVSLGPRASSGFKTLDNHLGGGLPVPGLGIFMAPPKGFKTTSLIHVARRNMARGKKVAYASTELNERVLNMRLASLASGVPIDDLRVGKGRRAAGMKLEALKRGSKSGDVAFKVWPRRRASVADIRNWLDRLNDTSGWKADLVIVDYADYLRPSDGQYKVDQERFIHNAVYDELCGLSSDMKIPVWSAALLNREGAERSAPTMENIAESYTKAAVADLLVSISHISRYRTKGEARLYIAGSRICSSGGRISVKVHKNTLWLEDLGWEK